MITIFRSFHDMTPNYRTIDAILHRIRSGKSAEMVNAARNVYNDRVAYDKAKKRLPCVLFSGQFQYRSIAGLINPSGFICLDFDKFPNEAELALWRDSLDSDEYTYSVFTSPSGMGLKCVVKIPPEPTNHKAYFRGLQDYYDCPYFDPNVHDVSRICFESYDPELIINSSSKTWTTPIFDPEPAQVEYGRASLDQQETVRLLMKWWSGKYGLNNGSRNTNLFKLCITFSDYGIDYDYAFSIVSGFQMADFKLNEITTTINSAYKRGKNNFGKLKF